MFLHSSSLLQWGCLALIAICSGGLTQGQIDVAWRGPYEGSSASSVNSFWDEVRWKNESKAQRLAVKRGEIEAWIQNTGIKKENVLYYLWDIFRDAEEWIPFALPEDALPSATKAGEYFATVGCIASTDTNSQAWRCESAIRSVSNKSFTIYYPPAEPALNARAKIANIPNAQGFTFTVAIHPAPSNGSLPDGCRPLKVLVIRARVWTFIEDSLRFVKRINPHLKLQNVNGDGNCGYWAVLASLRESITRNRIPQDSPLMQIPIIQAVAQKHDLNTWAPESTDHDLMSQLRVATQRDNIRELCQRQLTALELYLDEQTPPDRNPSALRNLLSLEPQAPANATRNNDGSSNGKTAEDWRAKVLTDIIKSAQELQQRVHKAKVPQEVKAQLWLELGEDAPDLVKAINLPLLVLTPPSQENPQWGAEGLETNGDSKSWENTFEGAGKGPWTAIPSLINLWIQDLPSLVKILNSGTHFLAVVDDDTPEEASHPPQMPPQVSRGPQSRKKS